MLDARVTFKPGEKIPFSPARDGSKPPSPSSPPRAKRRDPNGMGIRQPKLDLKGEGLGIKKWEPLWWDNFGKHFGPGNHPGTGTPQTVHAAETFVAEHTFPSRSGGEKESIPYKVVRKFNVRGVHRVRDATNLKSILKDGFNPLKSDGIFGRGTYVSYGDFSGRIAQEELIRGFKLDVDVALDKVIMVEYDPNSDREGFGGLMSAAQDYLMRKQPERFPSLDSVNPMRVDLRAELLLMGVDGLVWDKGMSLDPGISWGTQVVILDKDSITITPESRARAEKEAKALSIWTAKAHLPSIIMWADFIELLEAEELSKHAGPGDHPSGTPQTVHAGSDDDRKQEMKSWFEANKKLLTTGPDYDRTTATHWNDAWRMIKAGRRAEAEHWFDLAQKSAVAAAERSAKVDPELIPEQLRRNWKLPDDIKTWSQYNDMKKHFGPGDHPSGSPQSSHGVKGTGPKPEPDYAAIGDDEAAWDAAKREKEEWESSVRYRLSMGEITEPEARALGYHPSGHESGAGGWQKLPPRSLSRHHGRFQGESVRRIDDAYRTCHEFGDRAWWWHFRFSFIHRQS